MVRDKNRIIAGGGIVVGGDGKPERMIEKQIERADGTKEVTFTQERIKYLKKQKDYEKYKKQFNKVKELGENELCV